MQRFMKKQTSTKKQSLTPLYNRVVIRPLLEKKESQSPSGFILPEQQHSQSARGEVIAIGPGRVTEAGTRVPMSVAVGDVVVYAQHLADEVSLEGQAYVILNEEHISAILN